MAHIQYSGKRKAVEIEGPDAMQEREERKHTKISAKAAVLEIRRKKEEEQGKDILSDSYHESLFSNFRISCRHLIIFPIASIYV